MAISLSVLDATAPGERHSLEVGSDDTLLDLRHMLLSLSLPSCAAALAGASSGKALQICFDGKLLGSDRDDETLRALGVLDTPVVIVLLGSGVAVHAPPARGHCSGCSGGGAASCASRAALTGSAGDRSEPAAQAPRAMSSAAAPAGRCAPAATQIPATGMPAPGIPAPGTPAPELPAAPEIPEDALCRICFSAAHEHGLGELFSPCLCSGSMRFVHVACINDWRVQSANQSSFYQCDQCRYKYNIVRTQYAAYLEDVRLTRAVAVAMLFLAIAACALIFGPLHPQAHFYRLIQFDPSRRHHWDPRLSFLADAWGWRCDLLVAGVLPVAAAGLADNLYLAWQTNRHHSNHWIVGILATFASSGQRFSRVLIALGLAHSVRAAFFKTEAMSKRALSRWGTKILNAQR